MIFLFSLKYFLFSDLINNAQLVELQNQQASPPPDILIQNLKSAIDTTEVFDMICESHKEMTTPQVMQSLRTLFTLQKSGKYENYNEIYYLNRTF
jgi:hypothetical protein